jgi:UDP-N-acetylmuramoylalanine--D-glutamate ligase
MVSNLHIIVGLGVTGLSVARHLEAQNIPWMLVDTRLDPPNLSQFKQIYPERSIVLGDLNTAILQQASCIILSPGIALSTPAIAAQVKRGIPVIGDIELFARAVNVPVIAITGTNAKSTVTTLVGEMASFMGESVKVGGNLGVPALDLLDSASTSNLFVLELSSFQLETTYSLKPQVASILNITPDHMDRYQTLADYQQAKQRIYEGCHFVVCNRDDNLTDNQSISAERKLYFTLHSPKIGEFGLINQASEYYLAYEDQLLLPVRELPALGKHHYANALAALAIGHAYGWPISSMLQVLREFKGLPHRCQLVRECDDVKWYNDSKGTNVGASVAAIEGLGSTMTGKLILIAGGVGKQADFHPLIQFAKPYVRHLILIGEAAKEIAAICQDQSLSYSFADTLEDAVQQSKKQAKRGDAVLLSPACASFDMFRNYEHRGQVFTELVMKI